jgi:hypothetical protein
MVCKPRVKASITMEARQLLTGINGLLATQIRLWRHLVGEIQIISFKRYGDVISIKFVPIEWSAMDRAWIWCEFAVNSSELHLLRGNIANPNICLSGEALSLRFAGYKEFGHYTLLLESQEDKQFGPTIH